MNEECVGLNYYYLDDEQGKRHLNPKKLKQDIQMWGLVGSTSTFAGGIPVVESGFLHNIFVKKIDGWLDEVLSEAVGREVGEFYYKDKSGSMVQLNESQALELVDRYGLDFFNCVFIQDKSSYVSIEEKLLQIIRNND